MGKKKYSDHRKEKHEQRRHSRFRWKGLYTVLVIAVLVVVVAGLAVLVATQNRAEEPGTFVPSMGNLHISDTTAAGVQYNSNPPTSGPHSGEGLAAWGVHPEPVPTGLMIHNLEDGGVVVSYDPKVPNDTVDRLAEIVKRYPRDVLMAPHPGLDTPIALTAWTRILKLNTLDEPKIVAFIEAYKGIDHHVRKP